MATRKTIVTTTTEAVAPSGVAATLLPNNNLSLRALYVRVDDDTGHTVVVDRAILGWLFDPKVQAFLPLPVGGVPPGDGLLVIRDDVTKTWTDPHTGENFTEWKEVDAALYRQWAAQHPEHINARGAQPQQAPPITEPSVGGVGLAGADHWGIGQEPPTRPQPWKPGR